MVVDVALPDAGSLVDPPNSSSTPLAPGAQPLFDGLRQMGAMSNALLISGRESKSGHPLMVAGPQVAYFTPQILMEEDVHAPAAPITVGKCRTSAPPRFSLAVLSCSSVIGPSVAPKSTVPSVTCLMPAPDPTD